jgi:hypothetical protein
MKYQLIKWIRQSDSSIDQPIKLAIECSSLSDLLREVAGEDAAVLWDRDLPSLGINLENVNKINAYRYELINHVDFIYGMYKYSMSFRNGQWTRLSLDDKYNIYLMPHLLPSDGWPGTIFIT